MEPLACLIYVQKLLEMRQVTTAYRFADGQRENSRLIIVIDVNVLWDSPLILIKIQPVLFRAF